MAEDFVADEDFVPDGKARDPRFVDDAPSRPFSPTAQAFGANVSALGAERELGAVTSKAGAAGAALSGAAQGATFGFHDEISAAIDTAAGKLFGDGKSYRENLAQTRGVQRSIAEDQPIANVAGNIAGSLITPVPFSGIKAATAGGKLAKGAATGAALGGAYGLGSSEGSSVLELARDTAGGAALGGTVGAAGSALAQVGGKALVKLHEKLRDSHVGRALGEKYVQTFGTEVLGMSKASTGRAWNKILLKDAEPGVEAQAAKKFVQSREMAPIETAARKGKWEDAIAKTDERLSELRPQRAKNYEAIREAAPLTVGDGFRAIDAALIRARNATGTGEAVSARELARARTKWLEDYRSADPDEVARILSNPTTDRAGARVVETPLLAKELREVVKALPRDKAVTRASLTEAVEQTGASADALRFADDALFHPRNGIAKWNPNAPLPTLELRGSATSRQAGAMDALGQKTEASKGAVAQVINGALEKHLDEVAGTSPAMRRAVDQIRRDDVKFSVLLKAKEGLKQALEKTQAETLATGRAKALNAAVGAVGAGVGIHEAEKFGAAVGEGDVLGMAMHGAGAVAGAGAAFKMGSKHASIAANRLGHAIEKLKASQSTRAADLVNRISARASGPVGTVTQSTLGAQQ